MKFINVSFCQQPNVFLFCAFFFKKLGRSKVLSSLDAATKVSIILTDDFPCINTNDLKR